MIRRAAALLIDLVAAALPVLMMAPVAVFFNQGAADGRLVAQAALMAGAFMAVVLFFLVAAVQCLRRKPTVGQKVTGSYIKPDTFREAVFRLLAGAPAAVFLVAGAPFLILLYPAWALADPDRGFPSRSGRYLESRVNES